jgi:hypothetical protein
MGAWYWIGVFAGLGAAIGIALATASRRPLPALVAAAAVGAVVGVLVSGLPELISGALGGALGAFGTSPVVAGTLRRGGTRGGTTAILGGVALVVAALAFVPVLGYLLALAVPALGLRLRRRTPDTHAGLRSLTK